ncbi:porin family protein [Flavobacterium sp. LHD-85]|uniref:porin family protein n=1 Tax=Flavobacterium sp. LHD-85 TaxID=3071410 RepID=UPI0027E119C5|nr:porin family protein [Flavobacterium sp. LHD-85]MDQ6529943.1 porin family protein [Flavobacterium sp. LHD-85]
MRKITLLLFTITLITFKTTAQESKFKFGVQAGLTYSSFRGYESFIDEDPGFSYLFGVSLLYKLNESLSLKADLDYDRKTQVSKGEVNYISDISYNRYSIKTTNYLNYITLPIMLKFSFTHNKSFYINGGPYLGYLLKSGWKYETSGMQNSDENLEDTKYRKSMDFGLSAGFGKEFKLNDNHNIYIELRENLGLTDISKATMPTDQSIKTNSVNLIAGFIF